jgi:hypothetical protein
MLSSLKAARPSSPVYSSTLVKLLMPDSPACDPGTVSQHRGSLFRAATPRLLPIMKTSAFERMQPSNVPAGRRP